MHSQNCVVTLLQSWLICSTECPMVWVQTRIPTLISPLIQSGKLWGTWGKTQNLTPFTQCMFIFRNSCNLWYIIKSYDSCNRSMSIKLSLCSPTVGLTDCPLIWNMMEVTVDPVCSCVCVCGHQLVEPYRHLERSFRLVRPLARATSSSPIMMQGMLPVQQHDARVTSATWRFGWRSRWMNSCAELSRTRLGHREVESRHSAAPARIKWPGRRHWRVSLSFRCRFVTPRCAGCCRCVNSPGIGRDTSE